MQLIAGMDAENADLGMFITSGDISSEAIAVAEQHAEETGKRIELVDGEQFAKMLVEHGIGATSRPAT